MGCIARLLACSLAFQLRGSACSPVPRTPPPSPGSGIFHSGDPAKRAKAIVTAVTHYNDPKIIAEASKGLGSAMSGTSNIKESQVSFRERGH